VMVLAGNVFGFIFEVPSGYLSDKIGHKRALIISKLSHIASIVSFLIGGHMAAFILGGILMNIGKAFHSGTSTAFFHETLRGLRRENEYTKVAGKLRSISFVVPMILTIFIPFFVAISYKIPFAIALIIDLVGLFAVLSFIKPPVKQEEIEEIKLTKFNDVIKEGVRLKFFRFVLFFAIVTGTVISVTIFRDAYQSFVNIPIIYYGIFFGISRSLTALLLAYNEKIKRKLSLNRFLWWHIVIFVALIATLGLFNQPWLIATSFILISGFIFGFFEVRNGYLLEIIKSSKFKATLLSVGPLIETLIIATLGFSMGWLITQTSYQFSFIILSIALFLTLSGLFAYIIIDTKKPL